jgi:capsular polysaccharide biosynthesis protein/Mrp family chromosome partitioning ATPase
VPDSPRPAFPRRWLSFLTRRALVLAALAAVTAGLVGQALVSRLPVLHSATATVLITPLEGNAYRPGGSGEDLINLTTEAEVMRSDVVAERVASVLPGTPDPEAVLEALDVAVVTNTQILEITFADEDAGVAVAAAQAFADGFLAYRVDRARASIQDQSDLLSEQVDRRQEDLTAIAAELAAAEPDSPQATLLSARLETVTSQITQLMAQIADLAATTLDPGQLVAYATEVPPGPLSAQVLVPVVTALLGAAGVLSLAFLWSLRNWRVRRARDLAQLDVGVLSLVHEVAATLSQWDEPLAADLTELHRTLLPQFSGEARRVLLVAATRPSQTTMTIAIARAAGQAGLEVVVVDTTGHLRLPGDAEPGPGAFSELLSARTPTEPGLVQGPDNVRVLPTGARLDPVALSLRGEAINEVLRALWATSDLVVLHAEHVDGDLGRAMAAACGHVVLETHLGLTHAADVRAAAEACSDVGARILGAVAVTPAEPEPHGRSASEHASPRAIPVPNWRRSAGPGHGRPASGGPEVTDARRPVGRVHEAPTQGGVRLEPSDRGQSRAEAPGDSQPLEQLRPDARATAAPGKDSERG